MKPSLQASLYNAKRRCVLCGQPEGDHRNLAKCLIIRSYMKGGILAPRGKERAKELGVKLIKYYEGDDT